MIEKVMMYITVKPIGKDKRRYESWTLRGRRISPGIYQFSRRNGEPFSMPTIQVQIDEPWSKQRVQSVVHMCTIHPVCFGHGDDCTMAAKTGQKSRWWILVTHDSPKVIEVRVRRYPPLKLAGTSERDFDQANKRQERFSRLADGPGFSLAIF